MSNLPDPDTNALLAKKLPGLPLYDYLVDLTKFNQIEPFQQAFDAVMERPLAETVIGCGRIGLKHKEFVTTEYDAPAVVPAMMLFGLTNVLNQREIRNNNRYYGVHQNHLNQDAERALLRHMAKSLIEKTSLLPPLQYADQYQYDIEEGYPYKDPHDEIYKSVAIAVEMASVILDDVELYRQARDFAKLVEINKEEFSRMPHDIELPFYIKTGHVSLGFNEEIMLDRSMLKSIKEQEVDFNSSLSMMNFAIACGSNNVLQHMHEHYSEYKTCLFIHRQDESSVTDGNKGVLCESFKLSEFIENHSRRYSQDFFKTVLVAAKAHPNWELESKKYFEELPAKALFSFNLQYYGDTVAWKDLKENIPQYLNAKELMPKALYQGLSNVVRDLVSEIEIPRFDDNQQWFCQSDPIGLIMVGVHDAIEFRSAGEKKLQLIEPFGREIVPFMQEPDKCFLILFEELKLRDQLGDVLEARHPEGGSSIGHYLAQNGFVESLNFLAREGLNLDAIDDEGRSLMDVASKKKREDIHTMVRATRAFKEANNVLNDIMNMMPY